VSKEASNPYRNLVPLSFERSSLMLIGRFKVKRLFPTPTASKPKKGTQKHHCPHMLFHNYGCLSALVLVFTGVALREGNKTASHAMQCG
jgi:hypothetical protein